MTTIIEGRDPESEQNKLDILIFLKQAQARLAETDYVVTKLTEAQFLSPDKLEALKVKYAPILEEREWCRKEINYLESLLPK